MRSFYFFCQLAFWTCAAAVLYAYVLYPLLLIGLARCFGRRRTPPSVASAEWPTVSVLIAAYNEESVIAARIENALKLDYPKNKLEIAVASDGSDDATAAIVARYADRGVRLFAYPQRRGKASVLNATVPQLTGEIILFSDANTMTHPAAAKKLARWFKDPAVGAVCGKLVLHDDQGGQNADGLYWQVENLIKSSEASLGGLLGANGAIYAARRAWVRPIPASTIIDDFVLPLLIKLHTGCRIVYDREAIAHEETPPNLQAEFRRRQRIGAGGFQSLTWLWRLLLPTRGWIAFTFLSHKVLRWTCPFFLLGCLLSSAALSGQPLFRFLLLAQLLFYAGSCVVAWSPVRGRYFKALRLASMFTLMNGALLTGFVRWLSGLQKPAWTRTPRTTS